MNHTTQPDQPQATSTGQGSESTPPAQSAQPARADQPNQPDLPAQPDQPDQSARLASVAESGSRSTHQTLVSHWWLLALRGVLAILFGALALLMPGVTLLTLAALFAAFALVGGAVWTFGALRHRRHDERWWLMLTLGLVSLAAGAIAMLHPAMTTVVLIMLVGANALVTGVTDMVAAVRMRRIIRNEWLLVLSGIASVLFGVIVLLFPTGAGALALAALIAIYALLTGTMLVLLSLRLRAWGRSQVAL